MAIQTVGSLENILGNHSASKWTKSIDFNELGDMDFSLDEFKGLETTESKSFGEFLADSINDVNSLQVQANKAMERLATGETNNIQEVMLAANKAEVAFKTMNQVRSKVIDAYREIMRMQL